MADLYKRIKAAAAWPAPKKKLDFFLKNTHQGLAVRVLIGYKRIMTNNEQQTPKAETMTTARTRTHRLADLAATSYSNTPQGAVELLLAVATRIDRDGHFVRWTFEGGLDNVDCLEIGPHLFYVWAADDSEWTICTHDCTRYACRNGERLDGLDNWIHHLPQFRGPKFDLTAAD